MNKSDKGNGYDLRYGGVDKRQDAGDKNLDIEEGC